jgi:hypothetical protein
MLRTNPGSDVEVGTILAQHSAVAASGATAENHFQAALASRDVSETDN